MKTAGEDNNPKRGIRLEDGSMRGPVAVCYGAGLSPSVEATDAMTDAADLGEAKRKIKFGPQLRSTLLDLCREFDAVDLSDCNRRLEAGEKFDEACDAALERRMALGEQIKARLGKEWPEFECYHESLTVSDAPTEQTLVARLNQGAELLCEQVNARDFESARGLHARLGVLLS